MLLLQTLFRLVICLLFGDFAVSQKGVQAFEGYRVVVYYANW